MQKIILILCLCLLYSCQSSTNQDSLLTISFQEDNNNVSLTELLGHYKITPLELNEEFPIGRINKIVKRDGRYYILSEDKRIHVYDEDGHFLFVLNKLGKGPGEYVYIGDFDVYTVNTSTEIWLCDHSSIKIYSGIDGNYLRSINFNYVVNKFKKVGNRILLLTGQSDKVLTLTDTEGKEQKKFLEKEHYNIIFRSVQFIPQDNDFIYQIGLSNMCVKYIQDNESFEEVPLYTGVSNILTLNVCRDLFKKYETNYLSRIPDYTVIRGLHFFEDKAVAILNKQGKSFFCKVTPQQSTTIQFAPAHHVTNDITHSENMDFLYALGIADSDDSLLSFIDAYSIFDAKGLKKDSRTDELLASIGEEDNPLIIEWSDIPIMSIQF